jgi:hypothetical protein
VRLLDCWKRGFVSRRRHGCWSVVFVACFAGSGLCYGLITGIEECYRVCTWLFVYGLETSRVRRLSSCATGNRRANISILISAMFIDLIYRPSYCKRLIFAGGVLRVNVQWRCETESEEWRLTSVQNTCAKWQFIASRKLLSLGKINKLRNCRI